MAKLFSSLACAVYKIRTAGRDYCLVAVQVVLMTLQLVPAAIATVPTAEFAEMVLPVTGLDPEIAN